MKLYTIVYQFGQTQVVERHESEAVALKVGKWARSNGYALHTLMEIEKDVNQPRKEVYDLDNHTVRYFDATGNHLTNEY